MNKKAFVALHERHDESNRSPFCEMKALEESYSSVVAVLMFDHQIAPLGRPPANQRFVKATIRYISIWNQP